ncbi:hypothetical protein K227x_16810 [Rubripirellula lacrimiformis]|uniref:(5-formylfuran-3-yl)methyl phosphate synthase n=1 Tax=Rubripirellula lacrimiformis TaxID=1930273 RepID=A0A517N838_9BACT|nr:(5-formylfuran-3-yl)methyl phosphate synthase [Rubripirellula lacrimiformis]QDT03299.1 hypothetical protein K227x_16810 [Rubripirellula lacrimiformis]
MTIEQTSCDRGHHNCPSPPSAPQWLVSLRSQDELRIALQHPIDILDLKEPRKGPLAAAPAELWHAAIAMTADLPQSPRLSAALGESQESLRIASDLPAEFAFAKMGPSDSVSMDRLCHTWDRVRSELAPSIQFVAVAYADHTAASCPDPVTIFRAASRAGIQRCLIDTFVKDGKSTLDHLNRDQITELAETARAQSSWWALAGSVGVRHFPVLSQWNIVPDCIGVRGDVCDQDRTSELSPQRMRDWSAAMARSFRPAD